MNLKDGLSEPIVKWSFIEELDHQSKQKSNPTLAREAKSLTKNLLFNFEGMQLYKTFELLPDHLISTDHPQKNHCLYSYDDQGSPRYSFIDTNVLIFDLINLKKYLALIANTNIIPVISFMVQAELESQLRKRPTENLEKAKAWLENVDDRVMFEEENQMERACQELGLCIRSCGDSACSNSDNKILTSCLYWRSTQPNHAVSVITNDVNFTLKATIHGFAACGPAAFLK